MGPYVTSIDLKINSKNKNSNHTPIYLLTWQTQMQNHLNIWKLLKQKWDIKKYYEIILYMYKWDRIEAEYLVWKLQKLKNSGC